MDTSHLTTTVELSYRVVSTEIGSKSKQHERLLPTAAVITAARGSSACSDGGEVRGGRGYVLVVGWAHRLCCLGAMWGRLALN